MKKKVILIICLILVLAIGLFVLTGCGNKTEENSSSSNKSQSTEKNSSKDNKSSSKKEVTEIAKSSASNYKIEPEKMGIEYEVIDGYYHNENKHLELLVYLNKSYDKEGKINLHNSLVDYFKTVADDGKVYNLYLDEEYDKADTEQSGIWIRATINGVKCKIYFGGHSAGNYGNDSYSESYRITVDPES